MLTSKLSFMAFALLFYPLLIFCRLCMLDVASVLVGPRLQKMQKELKKWRRQVEELGIWFHSKVTILLLRTWISLGLTPISSMSACPGDSRRLTGDKKKMK